MLQLHLTFQSSKPHLALAHRVMPILRGRARAHRLELDLVASTPLVHGLVQLDGFALPLVHLAVVLEPAKAFELRDPVLPATAQKFCRKT